MILEDLAMLQIKPDVFSYTSDYFDVYIDLAGKLVSDGMAYVDNTPPDQMKQERDKRIPSKCRNNCGLCVCVSFVLVLSCNGNL